MMKRFAISLLAASALCGVALAQTPTLPADIASLNTAIAQLQTLAKSPKTLAMIIKEMQSVSANLAMLVPTPPPPPPACVGTAIVPPAVGAILMPPVVPQPASASDIVGVKLQNTAAATSAAFVTFGQMFRTGSVLPTDGILGGQLDALALYSDGSVKLAAITVPANLCASSEAPLMLSKASAGTPLAMPAVALTVSLLGQTLDLGAALATSSDVWLHGPLAVQKRVDLPVPGQPTLHITADVTAYADGSVTADVQLNNDLTSIGTTANPPALPALVYAPTITLNGKTTTLPQVTQYQFQDWIWRSAAPLNVQHDLAYLERTGAILPYDPTTGVLNGIGTAGNTFDGLTTLLGSAGFGTPLAANGVDQYMPDVGGRPDIGYTTTVAVDWLLTGDARAATAALAWGDTGGAVPWNIKLASTGHWLTTLDNPQIWVDYRSAITPANSGSAATGWTAERAHAPNLAYVPWIMTGERWYLDRLNAQAAWVITSMTPDATYGRCAAATCDIEMTPYGQQGRGMAWSMREIEEAGWAGKAGSWEQSYFASVSAHNWSYAAGIASFVGANQGEVQGWWPRIMNGQQPNDTIVAWEQDFITGIAALAAGWGDANAAKYVQWQHPWLTGRFGIGVTDSDPLYGCTYDLVVYSATMPITILQTWSAIDAATGPNNQNAYPNGWYCPIARSALGAALMVTPGDAQLTAALAWLNANGTPAMSQASFRNDPTFNVAPLH